MTRKRGFPRPDDLERMVALRHMGAGPFGGGRGRARRGDVRMALLMLLADEPRNGYQLMQAIEERSGGRWRPSPGSVYPTLSQLEDEGLIRSVDRDGTRLFEITDAGREQLSDRHDEEAPWESDAGTDTIGEMKSELKRLHATVMFVLHTGDAEQVARAVQLVADTRRSLYKILAEDAGE
jgi:DNA-binding PadR family transcriptional regulator